LADFLGGDWQSYYSFGLVRNPWDRVVSIYRFIQETPNSGRHAELAGLTFEQFLMRPRTLEAGQPRQNWDNLSDRTGERQLVTEIFRFEDIADAYSTIARRCGLDPTELPRLNATTRADYRQYYTPKLADRVADLFEVDILRFGYRF
jgi:Sulfotransferase family